MRTRAPLISSATSSVANLTSVLHTSKTNPDLETRVCSLEMWASSSYKITQKLLQSLNHIQRTFGKTKAKLEESSQPRSQFLNHLISVRGNQSLSSLSMKLNNQASDLHSRQRKKPRRKDSIHRQRPLYIWRVLRLLFQVGLGLI